MIRAALAAAVRVGPPEARSYPAAAANDTESTPSVHCW